jgi:hypothetical protein
MANTKDQSGGNQSGGNQGGGQRSSDYNQSGQGNQGGNDQGGQDSQSMEGINSNEANVEGWQPGQVGQVKDENYDGRLKENRLAGETLGTTAHSAQAPHAKFKEEGGEGNDQGGQSSSSGGQGGGNNNR